MSSDSEKRRRRRWRLFGQQLGLCHWCKCPMILKWKWDAREQQPGNLATLDHLRDKFDPTRQERNPMCEERLVLACWDCNNKRGNEAQKSQPREELWRRAGHLERMQAAE